MNERDEWLDRVLNARRYGMAYRPERRVSPRRVDLVFWAGVGWGLMLSIPVWIGLVLLFSM